LELRECRPSFGRLFSLSGHGRPAREKALMDGPTELIAGYSTSSQQDVEPPRSPARAQLAVAIAELARAGAELARAQEPAVRLSAVVAKAARLEAEISALRAADDTRLGAWLAEGGADPRPERAPATILAEKRCEVLAADAIAARTALPAAEQSFQHAPGACVSCSATATRHCALPQSTRRATLRGAIARR
jgi:hypothetical protein